MPSMIISESLQQWRHSSNQKSENSLRKKPRSRIAAGRSSTWEQKWTLTEYRHARKDDNIRLMIFSMIRRTAGLTLRSSQNWVPTATCTKPSRHNRYRLTRTASYTTPSRFSLTRSNIRRMPPEWRWPSWWTNCSPMLSITETVVLLRSRRGTTMTLLKI